MTARRPRVRGQARHATMMRRTAKVAAERSGGDASSSGRGIDGSEGANGGTHPRDKDCPVDKEELGRGLMHLHTTAYWSDNPDALRKVQARRFFDALVTTAESEADDFRVDKARNPPRVESRTALSVWLCERHNEVNEKEQGQSSGGAIRRIIKLIMLRLSLVLAGEVAEGQGVGGQRLRRPVPVFPVRRLLVQPHAQHHVQDSEKPRSHKFI